jgi:hypothetical protein
MHFHDCWCKRIYIFISMNWIVNAAAHEGGHVVVVVVVSVGMVVQNDRVTSQNCSLHRLIPPFPGGYPYNSNHPKSPSPTYVHFVVGCVCGRFWAVQHIPIPRVAVADPHTATDHATVRPTHTTRPTSTNGNHYYPNGWLYYYFCSGGDVCVCVCVCV